MSRSPRRPPAEASVDGRPSLALVVLAALAVLVTAADTYVVVLALPDILTGVGVGLDELQRATPIVGGFLLGYTATLAEIGSPFEPCPETPADCAVYDAATDAAVLTQLHTVFAGAAVAAGLAAVAALVLLRTGRR